MIREPEIDLEIERLLSLKTREIIEVEMIEQNQEDMIQETQALTEVEKSDHD